MTAAGTTGMQTHVPISCPSDRGWWLEGLHMAMRAHVLDDLESQWGHMIMAEPARHCQI